MKSVSGISGLDLDSISHKFDRDSASIRGRFGPDVALLSFKNASSVTNRSRTDAGPI